MPKKNPKTDKVWLVTIMTADENDPQDSLGCSHLIINAPTMEIAEELAIQEELRILNEEEDFDNEDDYYKELDDYYECYEIDVKELKTIKKLK